MVDPGSRQPGRRQLVAVGVAASIFAFLPATAQASPGLKIGGIEDMSSIYADVAGKGSVLATTMAVQDVGGSVLGGPIIVVSADALNKPDLALSVARQWWDAEGVDWDVSKLLETIPGDQAFRSLDSSGCTPMAL